MTCLSLFGVVLTMTNVSSSLRGFRQLAYVRYRPISGQGQTGEQATMFFYDPSGNALEFKAFADDANLFAR